MFGFSFGELMVICVVALVAVGPQRLPGLLGTLGAWIRKARTMVHDMRAQSGIDDILRAEGLQGGINELRSLMRVQHTQFFHPDPARPTPGNEATGATGSGTPEVEGAGQDAGLPTLSTAIDDPYRDFDVDPTKEYPPEGADSYDALPDDLVDVVPFSTLPTPSPIESLPEPVTKEPAVTRAPVATEVPAATATQTAVRAEPVAAEALPNNGPVPANLPAADATSAGEATPERHSLPSV